MRLWEIVGPNGWASEPFEIKPYLVDWRGIIRGDADLVLKPSIIKQVADIVRTCAEAGIGVTRRAVTTAFARARRRCGAAFLAASEALTRIVYDISATVGGSFAPSMERGCYSSQSCNAIARRWRWMWCAPSRRRSIRTA